MLDQQINRPRILAHDSTTWFLELRRTFRQMTGRELGFAHATRLLARRFSSWQELPIEGPDGLPLFVDLRLKEGNFSTGYFGILGHVQPLLDVLRPGDVLLDVGANIGAWSRYLLSRRELGRVVAFEPARRNFELLRKNLAKYSNATCINAAVGAHPGSVQLSADLDSGQNHVVTDLLPARTSETVQMVSLDSWAEESGLERLDALKIDVEGLEFEVLQGARETLRRFTPIVYFEYIPCDGPLGERKMQAFEHLASLGYEMQALRNDGTSIRVTTAAACRSVDNNSHDVLAMPAKSMQG
jgi:FkbM family methyltransferase